MFIIMHSEFAEFITTVWWETLTWGDHFCYIRGKKNLAESE